MASSNLPLIQVPGYGLKVFALQGSVKPLDPVVKQCSPSHDAKLSSGATPTITLTFSENMNSSTVMAAFLFDSKTVPMQQLSFDAQTNQLTFTPTAPLPDGIHEIYVAESAATMGGKPMFGSFRSRFLTGNSNNILVNNSFTSDPTMLELVSGTSLKVNHKATGASLYRIKGLVGAKYDFVCFLFFCVFVSLLVVNWDVQQKINT